MKKLMTIIMMAMVIFMASSTKVEAKELNLKKQAEDLVAEEFDQAMDEMLGVGVIFIKDRDTKVTISDNFVYCTIDSKLLLNQELTGEDHDIQVEYIIRYNVLTSKILSYKCYMDGELIEDSVPQYQDTFVPEF